MLAGVDDLLAVVGSIYGADGPPRRQLKRLWVLGAIRDVQRGGDPRAIARGVGVAVRTLQGLAAEADPVCAVFKKTLDEATEPRSMELSRKNLGQMLPGQLAERVFAAVFARTLGTTGLTLKDERHAHTGTDFLVVNGSDRNVMRLNVKFHGTLFRQAREQVGLDPEDCFALATYKIISGVKTQTDQNLLYAFAVVSVPSLTGDVAGAVIPESLVHLPSLFRVAKAPGRKNIEDAIIRHLIDDPQPDEVARAIAGFAARIDAAPWRMLSVNKAFHLLRELFIERVYAVKVPRFTQAYKGAEVDMHFSLTSDFTAFEDVVRILQAEHVQGLTYRMGSHPREPKPQV